jgi:integration host factor subunit alpha
MALVKADLVKKLMQQPEGALSKTEAQQFVDTFFEEISLALEKGSEVKLSGLGNFRVLKKKPRLGRNPKTGEDAPITARKVVTFHPGPKLKTQVATTGQKLQKKQKVSKDS